MVTKKGYARLHTSLGDVNLELHCDLVPRTCHNFILLAKSGFYKQTGNLRTFFITIIYFYFSQFSFSSLYKEFYGKIISSCGYFHAVLCIWSSIQ